MKSLTKTANHCIMSGGLKGEDHMIVLTEPESRALHSMIEEWRSAMQFRIGRSQAIRKRFALVSLAEVDCFDTHELSEHNSDNKLNALIEVLYDFLLMETMNQVREYLSAEELKRLEILRQFFAKILANACVNGREMSLGSIYLAPAELVKIGLHNMLQFPEIELLHYARKADGGMLRVIAQFLWHRDYGTKDRQTVH